jgi:antitoxin VapB
MLTVITTKGYSVNSYNQIMETAEIFEYDREYQAVRLPKDFAFRGNQVYLKRLGNFIVLLPYNNPWEGLIESLSKFSDDFMSERNQ